LHVYAYASIIWLCRNLVYMEVARAYITSESSLCVEWHSDMISQGLD